jgi:hypothetical protein
MRLALALLCLWEAGGGAVTPGLAARTLTDFIARLEDYRGSAATTTRGRAGATDRNIQVGGGAYS